MTNTYEINDLIEFLDKYKITFKQFAYCMLLHHDKIHSRIEGSYKISRPLSKMYKYHQNIENFTKNEIQDLIDKKLLEQTGKRFKPDMLEVTDKFKKNWYGDKFKFDQLLKAYPKFIENFNHPNRNKIPLTLVDDMDALRRTYNKLVKTYKMHNRVIELVEWAKDTDNLKVGLQKFVNSRFWEQLEELKETDSSYDNHTMI